MRRYLALALACVLAAVPVSALAMGLGEIRLNSHLNQRLDAEIELVSAAADELESLQIRLATPAAFERYGLERDPFLNNLQFRVVRRPNGTAYVKVTSTEPVREPFLTVLVEADWSRGRLLREYTVLLDPPTFAPREQTPEAEAPAITPLVEDVQRPPVREAEPVVEQPRTEEAQTGDVVSIPPLEADAEQVAPVRREPAYQEPQLGGNYGPIQRNETLWGIAQRLRPDESVTINQMMIALFRANPEAFQGNINRLKAGYILRVPEYREIAGIARRDAFNEVRSQNEEWRAGTRPVASTSPEAAAEIEAEPELSLVAPEEEIAPADAGTGVGAGEEAGDLDTGDESPVELGQEDIEASAVDLGVEDETSDRLLDIEDESLQALQEQDGAPATEETSEQELLEAPPLPAEQEPAQEQTAEPVEGETPPVGDDAQPQEQVDEETPREQPVVAPVREEPGLMERVMEFLRGPLGLGVAAAVLVLLLIGALVARRRREAATTRTATEDSADEEAADDVTILFDDEEPTRAPRDADSEAVTTFAADRGGDEDFEEARATQSFVAPAASAPAGGQAMTLDENDPLSEADFHMAYGLYDQAADVVQRAVERDPSRKEFHAKLAEIHFAANNSNGFMEAARNLKELTGPGDPDWDNVAIMGRQIAPDSDLFAGGGTSSVDLDFGTAGAEYGEAPTPSPASRATAEDSLDFDISLDAPEEEPEAPRPASAASDALDFDMDLGDLGSDAAETPEETAEETPAIQTDTGNDFDFDLSELDGNEPASETAGDELSFGNEEETQTEFDRALQELSAFVDTNLPEQDAGDAVEADDDVRAELSLDDYSFDDDAAALAEETAGSGDDEEDIGEIGTKLDLARAYIDMGDPDGARGILEEVLSDGDADQQKEARELLDQLA